jgi:hypothetical protein
MFEDKWVAIISESHPPLKGRDDQNLSYMGAGDVNVVHSKLSKFIFEHGPVRNFNSDGRSVGNC